MANIKASTLKNRRNDNETSIDKVNARILSGNLVVEIEYKVVGGRKVRIPNAELPVTKEDVRDMLNRNRAVTLDELLELVGKNVMKYLQDKGFVRQQTASIFLVTKAAAKHYKLDKPMVGNYF